LKCKLKHVEIAWFFVCWYIGWYIYIDETGWYWSENCWNELKLVGKKLLKGDEYGWNLICKSQQDVENWKTVELGWN
jgi:hypothetical protein